MSDSANAGGLGEFGEVREDFVARDFFFALGLLAGSEFSFHGCKWRMS